jgi:peptidoglycan hydrolase CwlO-like protein
MKKRGIVLTILLLLFSTLVFVGLISYYDKPVYAQSSCPAHIPPDSIECLDYLRNQLSILQQQQGTIQNRIKDEEYQQLTLLERIAYTENQIEQTENTIRTLEVEIAAHDVEIKLFEKTIKEKEDNISVLGQEINVLESAVNKRVTESYKYSFVGPLELFMDIKNLSSILRKTKYLAITRTQDRMYLGKYSSKIEEIREEEDLLVQKRADLQVKRNAVEEEKRELAETRRFLSSQKAERERLLAESKANEAQLLASYQANMRRLASLDAAIIEYIGKYGDQAVNQGKVTAGTWIGRMGNTGLVFGSGGGYHLHFSIRNSHYGNPCSGNVTIFETGYLTQGSPSWLSGYGNWTWPFVHSGSLPLPIAGPHVIMSQGYHQGYAIDLISYRSNRTTNIGAPIYAVMDGQLFKATDGYGGNYAFIRHENGWTTCYLHLQ